MAQLPCSCDRLGTPFFPLGGSKQPFGPDAAWRQALCVAAVAGSEDEGAREGRSEGRGTIALIRHSVVMSTDYYTSASRHYLQLN